MKYVLVKIKVSERYERKKRNVYPMFTLLMKKACNLLIYRLFTCLIVTPIGFEPMAHSLEGCCSIQLSYGAKY